MHSMHQQQTPQTMFRINVILNMRDGTQKSKTFQIKSNFLSDAVKFAMQKASTEPNTLGMGGINWQIMQPQAATIPIPIESK